MYSSNRFTPPDYELEQTKISKTLLIQCLQDNFSQQYHVSIPYDTVTRELDLGKILHQIFFEILNPIYQYQIFYFSNLSGYFHFGCIYPFQQKFILGEEFIPKEQIFIAFRKTVQIDGVSKVTQTDSIQNQAQNKKKRRVNDRTILQTLQKVSIWRSKCEQEKITFEQAAKQIDIPKKTLDDYYALIRTGQELGFEFQKNLSQKIGVLRKFVKERQKQIKYKKQSIKKKQQSGSRYNEKQHFDTQEQQYLFQKEYFQKNNQPTERKLSIIDKMILQEDNINVNEENSEE